MATDLSVIMILTFALWVTSPLHELQSTAAFSQTTEKINSNWEPGVNVDLAVTMQRHLSNCYVPVKQVNTLIHFICLYICMIEKCKNNRKAFCPDLDSDNSGKNPRTSLGKGSRPAEHMNGRRNIKETASSSEVTSAVYNAVSEGTRFVEMLHNDASDHGCSRWGYFFLQNAGILLGFGIMLLISIFEHKIVFRINF